MEPNPYECPRCGQQSAGASLVCERCRATERAEQGTAMRLFTPPLPPITGQMELKA